jgi:hypothetical protein
MRSTIFITVLPRSRNTIELSVEWMTPRGVTELNDVVESSLYFNGAHPTLHLTGTVGERDEDELEGELVDEDDIFCSVGFLFLYHWSGPVVRSEQKYY